MRGLRRRSGSIGGLLFDLLWDIDGDIDRRFEVKIGKLSGVFWALFQLVFLLGLLFPTFCFLLVVLPFIFLILLIFLVLCLLFFFFLVLCLLLLFVILNLLLHRMLKTFLLSLIKFRSGLLRNDPLLPLIKILLISFNSLRQSERPLPKRVLDMLHLSGVSEVNQVLESSTLREVFLILSPK